MARRQGLIASEAIIVEVLVASEGRRVPRTVTNTSMGKGARQPHKALLFWNGERGCPYTPATQSHPAP